MGGALVEETALIARWLAQPGVRIVRADPGYASPVGIGRTLGGMGGRRHARRARPPSRHWALKTIQTF